MRINCQKEDLFYGVQAVAKAVSGKNTLPILSGIMLTAKDDKVILKATDLEMAIECVIDADTPEEGTVVAPGRYPYIPGRDWDYYVALAGGFIPERNSRQSIDIIDMNGNKLKKTSRIDPETIITARSNSFSYNFNQNAPMIQTTLTIISTALAIVSTSLTIYALTH